MTRWKLLLLPLALMVPLLAYVVGTLSTGPEGPTQPEPVILQDESSGDRPGPGDRPVGPRRGDDTGRGDADDRGDDNGTDDDGDGADDTDDPEVVLPSPTRLDDDGSDDDDDGSRDGDDTDDGGGD